MREMFLRDDADPDASMLCGSPNVDATKAAMGTVHSESDGLNRDEQDAALRKSHRE
ncbi:hypothetical protein [Alicyclobacillus ferrooxydans]|nr:hypothetical protein [Alicyclobacillus ferrooxydans]